MGDYELWYAVMEDVRQQWVQMRLTVPVDNLPQLLDAARDYGISTAEFIEMVVMERLTQGVDWWEEFYAERLENGPEPCFFCGEPAEFIDYSFEAPFCNSGVCNWALNEDLRMSTAWI